LAAARPLPRMALYQHRAAVRRMAKKCKCVNVRVFGSVARGEDTYRSDIDLVVTPMAGASLFDLAGFAEFVEELTGYHVDVVSDRGRNADDPIVVESLAV
jgi:predicted nucleotidyltransferase